MPASALPGQTRTPKKRVWQSAFLETLRRTGNVSEAARTAKAARSTAHEAKSTDEAFAAA